MPRVILTRLALGATVLLIVVIVAFIVFRQVGTPSDVYGWDVATPESQGMDPLKLSRLRDDLISRDSEAILVLRHGRVVLEWYEGGFGKTVGATFDDLREGKLIPAAKGLVRGILPSRKPQFERHNLGAMSKSLVYGAALAAAADRGRIGLDDPAWQYIPEWKDDPQRSDISIRHLVTQTSGMENVRFPNNAEGWKGEFSRDVQARFSLARSVAPILAEPGTEYVYSSTGFYILSYAIEVSLNGHQEPDLRELLNENILKPAGIPSRDWSLTYSRVNSDVSDTQTYATRAFFTTRAVARMGELFMGGGEWQGQQLVSSPLMDQIVTYTSPSDLVRPPDTPAPTVGGWSNYDGTWPAVPTDAFVAVGANHKMLLVVPSLDLVVVRFGGSLSTEDLWTEQGGPFFEPLERHLLNPLMEAVVDR